jgi:hypothetical protein
MIVPVLITLGVLGALYASRPRVVPDLSLIPAVPIPPSPPSPPPPQEPRPFAGLPYSTIVRLFPERNVFNAPGGAADLVKIVGGNTNPVQFRHSYLVIDTRSFLPEEYRPRRTVHEDEIMERVS